MNFPLLSKLLGRVCLLIGGAMVFCLPWAFPALGFRLHIEYASELEFETRGFLALLASILICGCVGGVLSYLGRRAEGVLYRKEAMAVVGLSWILATVLGAMPYLFAGTYRSPSKPMNPVDCLFESQSGFSTTGATVISQLEDPQLVPHCILFWRSMSHFLGGLGIIVLFVVVLGHGSAGKAMMRAEMPGPTKEGATPRMQDTAWLFAITYLALNLVLAGVLWTLGLSVFDALCHAFGTMATGGFSTYNASLGHFQSPAIDGVVILFMILAGTNFTLLFWLIRGQPGRLLADPEWRAYIGIIAGVTVLVVSVGMIHRDFADWASGFRYGLFQVVSIMTTTGYGTHDFDQWTNFGRGVLFLLMFVGGCSGSTGGGLKVIRHVLFVKILRLEVEQSYRPSVVRPLRLGGQPVEDRDLRKNVLVYFSLILAIFMFGWVFVFTFEPDGTWEGQTEHKLLDSASSIAATLNNIGPGLGEVGATRNYGDFSWWSKTLFVWLMMIGRLEIFAILVLFVPAFWRSR
jgi:trk system potassium uptake protein TrkH